MPEMPAAAHPVSLRALRDHTALARIIPVLSPAALVRLFDAVGMNDAGSLMALTPPTLLARAVEEAVWQETADATRFDADVFADWLAVWLAEGDACAAERLLALDEDLLTLCFDKLIDVHDAAALGFRHDPETGIDPQAVDPGDRLVIDRFVITARDDDTWEAARGGALALWDESPDRLLILLERLSLAGGAVLEHDAAAARDAAREGVGFVPAAAARGFLGMAAALTPAALLELSAYDPESARQLRRLRTAPASSSDTSAEAAPAGPMDPDVGAQLAAAGIIDPVTSQPAAAGRLTAPTARPALPLEQALARQSGEAPERFARSSVELAYLANVLLSARSPAGPPRRREAAARDLAMATANLGMELLQARGAPVEPGREPGLIKAFLVGWRSVTDLPRRVVEAFERAYTAPQAAGRLAARRWLLAEVEESLDDLRRAVRAGELEAARQAVGLLSLVFDVNACRAVSALLDDVAAFPRLLENGDRHATRPIATRGDLERLAALLDGLAVRD